MVCCINVTAYWDLGLYSQEDNEVQLFCLISIYNVYVQIHVFFAQASQGIFWQVLDGWQHDEMRGNT